jgi:hypothetical protein
MEINIRWIRDIPAQRLANVTIGDGFSTIDLGALDDDELWALAQDFRHAADELDPEENN